MRIHMLRFALVIGILLVSAACTAAPAARPSATIAPSPTIAAVPSAAPASVPAPAAIPAVATATRPAPTRAIIATANPTVFSYLWPAYLPQGMVPMPGESRIAKDTEIGTSAAGFFLITFNAQAGTQKIILGGGSVEPLPLTGDTKQITLDGRKATLVTNGDQRLVRFDTQANQGSLFLFTIGVSEQDLLLTAESLLPITPSDMRVRVGL